MPPWLSSLFVHPEYVLPGAALLSLPLIIHFINRLRFRRVKFAAMEFLLASQQRNRRRILLEQLLLLLLRCLLVFLAGVLFAYAGNYNSTSAVLVLAGLLVFIAAHAFGQGQ